MIFTNKSSNDSCVCFGCSRTGASHMRQIEPGICQDAYHVIEGTFSGEEYLIAAIADGHGDKRHDLSEFGSSLAVKTACETLLEMFIKYSSRGESDFSKAFKTYVPYLITTKWQGAVLTHFKSLPDSYEPTDESSRKKILSRYGTTIIAAMIVYDAIFIAQLGDGDAIFINQSDQIEIPFVTDGELVGSETYSLSSPCSHSLWHIKTCPLGKMKYIHLSTDGLKDSYPTDEPFHNFVQSICGNIIVYGMEKVMKILPQTIDNFSLNGSGDDITLVGVLLDRGVNDSEGVKTHDPETSLNIKTRTGEKVEVCNDSQN